MSKSLTILDLVNAPIFSRLFAPQKEEQVEALMEQIIEEEGLRMPVTYWVRDGKPTIVDGHTRQKIAQKILALDNPPLSVENFPIQEMKFTSDDDAKDWMRRNQCNRRNLTPKELSLHRAQDVKDKMASSSKAKKTASKSQEKPKTKTEARKEVADEHEVSTRTLKRDEQLSNAMEAFVEAGVAEEIIEVLPTTSSIGSKDLIQIAKEVNPKEYEKVLKRRLENDKDLQEQAAKKSQADAFATAAKAAEGHIKALCKIFQSADLEYESRPTDLLEFTGDILIEHWIRFVVSLPPSNLKDGAVATSMQVYELVKKAGGKRTAKTKLEALPYRSEWMEQICKK